MNETEDVEDKVSSATIAITKALQALSPTERQRVLSSLLLAEEKAIADASSGVITTKPLETQLRTFEGSDMSERDALDQMDGILSSVSDITIDGKFPHGASIVRKLHGESVPVKIEDENGGSNDFVFGRGYEKIRLHRNVTGLVNKAEVAIHMGQEGLPFASQGETQYLIIDSLNPDIENEWNQGPNIGKYAVVSYSFAQLGKDSSGRPLGNVHIRSLIQEEFVDQLVLIIQQYPDMIERYYQGIAEGLEKNEAVKRIKSDKLVIMDFRSLPNTDKTTIHAAENGTYFTSRLIRALDMQGKFQRIPFRDNVHGTIEASQNNNIRRTNAGAGSNPIVLDVQKGTAAYNKLLEEAKQRAIQDQQSKNEEAANRLRPRTPERKRFGFLNRH